MAADILIYALVAAGLVFWLRNILGTRHGDERERPNPFTSQPEKRDAPARSGAVKPASAAAGFADQPASDPAAGLERHMSIDSKFAETGLRDIAAADRAFDLPFFMNGAQDAFIMIVEAFAAGDKETLKMLLAPKIYEDFCGVIDAREKRGETASVEIHAVRKADVIDAQIRDGMAFITVRYTADETNVVRDADGTVVSGDPEKITETVDIWTFGRKSKTRDPAWLVYETRDDEDAA